MMAALPAGAVQSSLEALTGEQVVLFLAVMVAGGLVQAVSGFGFGLVSVGLLALVWPDVKTATILPLIPAVSIAAYLLFRLRGHVPWRRIAFLYPATLVMVPLGVRFLKSAEMWMVWAGLALLLIVGGTYRWLPVVGRHRWHRVWAGVPCGLLGGVLNGAFGTGGPPSVAYLSNQHLPHLAYAAGLQVVFVSTGLIRGVSLAAAGMLPSSILMLSAAGILAALIGCGAGLALVSRVSQKTMRLYVQVAQVALGLFYLTKIWPAG